MRRSRNLLVDTSRDGSKFLFLSTSDRNPGSYPLVDWATKQREKLLDIAPAIPTE